MSVPLFDLKPSNEAVRAELDATLKRVLDHGAFILGPEVEAFENACAGFLQSPHAVGVSSGTCAIAVSLLALGLAPGDEVVLPAFTYGATAMAVRWPGARPVFADVDPGTFNLSADTLAPALSERTKAVVPVHLFGRPADVAGIDGMCREAGATVVEDAAQSFGASLDGRQTGTIGTLGCYSFYPTKPLGGFGDGGLIATADGDLASALRTIRGQGDAGGYRFVRQGGNFRLDAIQAALLAVKLRRVEAWQREREAAAGWYAEAFASAGLEEEIGLPAPVPEGMRHAWALCVVRAKDRDGLRAHLAEKGIGAGVYYPSPLHLQPAFADLGYEQGAFPHAEKACREVLALPLFAGITQSQVGEVVEAVRAFYRR